MKTSFKTSLFAAVTCSLLLTGCVPSVNPLFTPDTTVFQEGLIGLWKEKPDDEESWTFTKADDNSYTVTIQEKGTSSKFQGLLVKLDETFFLDLYPSEEAFKESKLGDFYKASLVPAHLILKIKIGSKLEIQTLKQGLTKHLAESPNDLAHAFPEKEYLVLTASTADLQKFFKKHANTAAFWSDASALYKVVL